MSEFLAEASVLIRPDTTKFAATLQAELTAATRNVVIPVAVAPITAGAGVQQAVASTNALAGANTEVATTASTAAAQEVKLASAAQAAGAANRKAAADAAEHAAAMSQLARGAGATGLSLLGARGATLAAGSEFLVGAAGVTLLAKSIQGASEDAEALADVTQVLGQSLGQRLADDAAKLSISLGIVDEQIVRFEASLALIFKNIGLTDDATLQYSQTLLTLARNLSSVKDIPVEDAFRAIQSALLGNLRALRQLGIGLDAATIRQRALQDSGKELASSLTQQELTLARYSLLLEKTSRFSGAWAEEQDHLQGKSQVLKARIDQLGDSIGKLAIPGLTQAIDLMLKFGNAVETVGGTKIPKLNVSLGDLALRLNFITGPTVLFNDLLNQIGDSGTDALGRTAIEALKASDAFHAIVDPLLLIKKLVGDVTEATKGWNAELSRAVGTVGQIKPADAVAAAGEQITLGQIAGANPAQQIANLNARIEANRKLVADANRQIALGVGDTRAAVEARREAQEQIASDLKEIESIQNQQASAAKAASDAAQNAADEAKRAAEERKRAADQRVQDRIDAQQSAAEIRLTNAQVTKGLDDDIKAQIAIRNLIQKQIRVLVPQIQDVRLRNQVLQALTAAEAQTKAAITSLFQQRNENREAAKEAARQAKLDAAADAVESLDLDIQLAETTGNLQKQISLHQQKIAALKKEQSLFKKGTLEWKRLRNEIAAEQKAIDDLKGQTQKTGTAARDFFDFLQRQQGFASNLLGNLFPASAASAALAAATPPPVTPKITPPSADLSEAAQVQAGKDTGPTAGQAQTTNQILRAILRTLQASKRGSEHPEARSQRAVGSAVMDIA